MNPDILLFSLKKSWQANPPPISNISLYLKRPKKRAAPMETEAHPRAYLTYLSWSQVKEPPGPPHGVPSERYAPFLEPSFIHHSRSLVYEPPSPDSRFPSDINGPLWREMPICGASLITSSRAPMEAQHTKMPWLQDPN